MACRGGQNARRGRPARDAGSWAAGAAGPAAPSLSGDVVAAGAALRPGLAPAFLYVIGVVALRYADDHRQRLPPLIAVPATELTMII